MRRVYGGPGRQACAEHMEVGERALKAYAALDVRRRVRRRLADGFNDNGEVSTGECPERNQILDAFLLAAGAVTRSTGAEAVSTRRSNSLPSD